MRRPRQNECPKCGGYMFGPEWVRDGNRLRYFCGCGFSKTEPANDSFGRRVYPLRQSWIDIADLWPWDIQS